MSNNLGYINQENFRDMKEFLTGGFLNWNNFSQLNLRT